jgi:hypothetical protein
LSAVEQHQRRTVANFLELKYLWDGPEECPFMPALQGQSIADYMGCLDLFDAAGIDFLEYPVVGVGSVCRRQATATTVDTERVVRRSQRIAAVCGLSTG